MKNVVFSNNYFCLADITPSYRRQKVKRKRMYRLYTIENLCAFLMPQVPSFYNYGRFTAQKEPPADIYHNNIGYFSFKPKNIEMIKDREFFQKYTKNKNRFSKDELKVFIEELEKISKLVAFQ